MDVTATTTTSASQSSLTTSQASQPSSQSSNAVTVAATAPTTFSLSAVPSSQSSSTSGFNPVSSSCSLSQDTTTGTTSSSTLVDANAPELFKQNIQIAMEQVARVNALARSASNGIQNAYQAGVNPAQTKADLAALDQALHTLADLLRQSGVGAYPLPAPASLPAQNGTNQSGPPTEQQLIADTTRGVQKLYDEFKRMQDSSAVVANLSAVQESVGRPKA